MGCILASPWIVPANLVFKVSPEGVLTIAAGNGRNDRNCVTRKQEQ